MIVCTRNLKLTVSSSCVFAYQSTGNALLKAKICQETARHRALALKQQSSIL